MKIYLVICVMSISMLLTACGVEYVSSVPEDQVVVRTEAPYAGAVWVDNEWRWDHGHYVGVPAHWENGRGEWHRGSWEKGRRGYTWKRGYWH